MRLHSDSNQESIDRDGVLMLLISIVWGLALLGLPFFGHFYQVYQTAKRADSSLRASDNTWIVFGKQLQNNQMDLEFQQRVQATAEAAAKFLPETIVFQGGLTANNERSEAEVAQCYFKELTQNRHVDNKTQVKIFLEDGSRNTLENLKETRKILLDNNTPLDVVLVSNRYHLHRCSLMATTFGFKVKKLPAETNFKLDFVQIKKMVFEAFLINWFCTGKFVSHLLNNQRMLNKIR